MLPRDLGLPPRFLTYRPGQLDAALTLATDERRFQVLCAPCGTGKSLISATAAKLLNVRTLVLTSTKALQSQWASEHPAAVVMGHSAYKCVGVEKGKALYGMARVGTNCAEAPCRVGVPCALRFAGCTSYDARSAASRAQLVVANYALWLALEQYGDGDTLGQFDVIVADECVPATTQVGGRRIADITVGDKVPCFDPSTLKICYRTVTRTMKNVPSSLVRLSFGAQSLVCTPGHPVLTVARGWVPAGALNPGFDCVLCSPQVARRSEYAEGWEDPLSTGDVGAVHVVPEDSAPTKQQEVRGLQVQGQGVLLSRVWEGIRAFFAAADERQEQRNALSPNDREESHAQCQSPSKDEDHPSGYGMEASNSRGEWEATTCPCGVVGLSIGLGNGVPGTAENQAQGIPDIIQTGHSRTGTESGNRGRWIFALLAGEAASGPQEGQCLIAARLDRVEVLQPSSDGTFGGVCPDGLVYNLEVDELHTYIANGLAVHNCHNAEQWVCKAASTEISADDLALAGLSVPLALGDDQDAWRAWAGEVVHIARETYRAARDRALGGGGSGGGKAGARSPELVALADLGTKLRTLADPKFGAAGDTRWVVVATNDGVTLTPVWAHAFAEKLLWRGVGRVLLTSATITRNDARYLGLGADTYAFHEVASTFPPTRYPFIYHPVAFIDYKLLRGQRGEDALQLVVNAFDNYMQPRLEAGRSGVVQTTSYEWSRVIGERSRLRERFIVHGPRDAARALAKYDASSDACALVSPAMKEGYDLADGRCRWQLIVKVPSPDKRDAVFAARCADDAGYRAHVIARSIEQMHGRGMRHAGDWSETAIFDRHFGYLRNEAPFTAGFRKTWRYSERMPMMMEVA